MQQGPAYRAFSVTVTERQGEFLERRRKVEGVPVSRTIQMALEKAYPNECKEPDDTETETAAEGRAA